LGSKGAAFGGVEGQGPSPCRLIDVAHLAKVSRATAARALGGYGLVRAATRERVIAAAQALNYRTNEVARAMRAGKTLTIGVVIADISNSFFSNAVRAISDTSARCGYQILVINTDDDLAKEIEAIHLLRDKRVDGLIVSPASPCRYEHLAGAGALVLFDRRIPELAVDTVTTDDRRGAGEAIGLFVARGHARIGLLVATAAVRGHSRTRPEFVVSTVRDRVAGASLALQAAGLQLRDEWVRYSHSDLATATQAALSLLASEPRPTAVLATNEEMALGLVAACRETGLVVGKDVSLIGFDDSPWAEVFTPAVSVVKRPIYDLGEAAVTSLVRRIGGDNPGGSVELATTLIDRQSVLDLRPT
jgi:LacI family transcriptional regulator